MNDNFSYLLLKFVEEDKVFSCQIIDKPNFETKSASIFFPILYYDAQKSHEIEIPQVNLHLRISPVYGGKTIINFEERNSIYQNFKFTNSPKQDRFKIASYIEDTLNIRLAELIQDGKEFVYLGIIRSQLNQLFTLQENNKNLENEIDHIQKKNESLLLELSRLNSTWYIKLVNFFKMKAD